LRLSLLLAMLLLIDPVDVIAEEDEHLLSELIVPSDNRDIEELVAEAEDILSLAESCSDAACPVFSCAAASQHYEYTKQMRFALRTQYYWTRKAADTYFSDLIDHIRQNTDDTDLIRRAELQVALQRALRDFGGTLLDVASIADQAKKWQDGSGTISDLPPEEVPDFFDDIYETAKDFQSIQNRYREDAGLPKGSNPLINLPDGFGLSGEDLDTLKSHLSDIKDIVNEIDEVVESGLSLREMLTTRTPTPAVANARVALGQIVGRYLTGIADKRINASEKSIDELIETVNRRQRQQSDLYNYYQPYAARRDIVEDAYRAYEELVVIGPGSGGYASCMQKMCTGISLNYSVDPGVPREFIGDPSLDTDYGANWAEAIPFWDERIATLHGSRPTLPGIEDQPPSLSISNSQVEPQQLFKVNVVAPACQDARYSVRLLDEIGHQLSEAPVTDSTSVQSWKAPDELGAYELQLLRDGTRVSSGNFHVSDPNVLVGMWSFRYQDSDKGEITGRLAVHPDNTVKGVFDGAGGIGGSLRIDGTNVTGRPIHDGVGVALKLVDGGNRLVGKWTESQSTSGEYTTRAGAFVSCNDSYEYWYTASGEEEWVRLPLTLTTAELAKPAQGASYPALVEQCDSAVVQGNFPEFYLEILGDGFPTWEWVWDAEQLLDVSIPGEPNIIINSFAVDENAGQEIMRVSGWLRCFPDSTPPLEIQPGRKTIMVNGVSTNWELVFTDYSGPPPIADISFVGTESGGYRLIENPIAIGAVVHVEVEFESPPSDETIDVGVRVPGTPASTMRVPVQRIETGGAVYRSPAIRITQ